jgi:hypothetical protein
MRNWFKPIVAFSALLVALDATAIAIVGLATAYSGDSAKCLPLGFFHAQWPKWIWCSFGSHESLAAGLLGAAGALVAAAIAAYAVWRQIWLSLCSREEDRLEKELPVYREAAHVTSDYTQRYGTFLDTVGLENLPSVNKDIDALPEYIREHMPSASDRLKREMQVLIGTMLNSARTTVFSSLNLRGVDRSQELGISPEDADEKRKRADHELADAMQHFALVFDILARREKFLSQQTATMEARLKSFRARLDRILI